MAIVPLDKLTICGTSDQKDEVLVGLQRLGCLHLVNLRGNQTAPPELVSRESRESLRYLIASPAQRRKTSKPGGYDRERLVEEVLQIKERREQLFEERDHVEKSLTELAPWGEYRLPPSDQIEGLSFWFYVVPLFEQSAFAETQLIWHVAASDHQFAYVVVLSASRPRLPLRPVRLDPRPLSELRQRLEEVDEELDELQWRRATLTRWIGLLQGDLDAADDRAAQLAAAGGTLDESPLFALQGWAPRRATPDVAEFASRRGLVLQVQKPTPEDAAPTLLHNPERLAGAEGCVTFYITPSYHAWDPTPIVFFSFSVFFAMIIADAGYGLLMAALVSIFGHKLGQSKAGERLRGLLWGVVAATILYGLLVGSYFGVSPPETSWLAALRITYENRPLMENQNLMMMVSVAIGVFHLVLANLVSAWRQRRNSRSLGHLGWALVMLGGFLTGNGVMANREDLTQIGKLLLAIGGGGVFLFSSRQPLATLSPTKHLRRLLDGVMQFANIPKAFGDVLSYLRLFALGLASAQLAVTFNGLAGDAAKVGGVGILLALLILLVGHGINFLLGLMSGVVHGLRLNCIEFFNWSLTEEGYSFQPFQKKAEA